MYLLNRKLLRFLFRLASVLINFNGYADEGIKTQNKF